MLQSLLFFPIKSIGHFFIAVTFFPLATTHVHESDFRASHFISFCFYILASLIQAQHSVQQFRGSDQLARELCVSERQVVERECCPTLIVVLFVLSSLVPNVPLCLLVFGILIAALCESLTEVCQQQVLSAGTHSHLNRLRDSAVHVLSCILLEVVSECGLVDHNLGSSGELCKLLGWTGGSTVRYSEVVLILRLSEVKNLIIIRFADLFFSPQTCKLGAIILCFKTLYRIQLIPEVVCPCTH